MLGSVRSRLPSWTLDVHRDGMLLVGALCAIGQMVGVVFPPIDARTYWLAGTSTQLYPEHWGAAGPGQWLFYPPPVAQLSSLLQPIGWNAFVFLVTVSTFAAMWYCARSWSFPLLLLGLVASVGWLPSIFSPFLAYAVMGNLQWLLAALTIFALRHPALWAIELVTKVTSAIGWWWFVLRGEWRRAAIGAAASLLVIGVSVAASPQLWASFIRFALANGDMANPPQTAFEVPFGVRLATGALFLGLAARREWRWAVPLVCGWCLPVLWGLGFLPFVVAGIRIAVDGTAVRMPARPPVGLGARA